MPDEIKSAVIVAMQDPQVSNAITDSVQKAIQEKLQTALPDVVKGAVLGAQQATDQKAHDPYRTTIHFLAGLIAFCLAVIVGIFNAFPDPPTDTGSMVYRMFGGVLAWISITALVATVSALIAQLRKYLYGVKQKRGESPTDPWKLELALLMGVPTLFGAIAVAYCVRGGAAILNGDAELIGMLKAICTLGGI
jgi:hypothetical protein